MEVSGEINIKPITTGTIGLLKGDQDWEIHIIIWKSAGI
jgi:hypothetical protein